MLYLSIAIGIASVWVGADSLVRGSVSLASRLGVNPLVIGLTVVAFGTSAPEFVVSFKAALTENGDIALGNVIGSNICNIGLILGLSALIRPLRIQIQTVRLDIPILIITSFLLVFFLNDLLLSRIEGLVFFAGFAGFLLFTLQSTKRDAKKSPDTTSGKIKQNFKPWLELFLIATGLILLIFGGNLLIRSSVSLSQQLKVSEALIGLTVAAVGTSLPELATTVIAAVKGEDDIAVGNIIGSNIFNILFILGISSVAKPIHGSFISFTDLLFMIGYSILIFPLTRSGFTLNRKEGGFMICLYAVYLFLLFRN